MMKTDLILKGKDAGDSAHSLHVLAHIRSQFPPRGCCMVLPCQVNPDFLAERVRDARRERVRALFLSIPRLSFSEAIIV